MAPITPNTATESQNKTQIRAVTRGGANPWYEGADPAVLANALAATSGVLNLVVANSAANFTISGTGGNSVTITGSSAKVSDLITALAAGPLSSTAFFVTAGPAQYLKNTTTTILIPGGATLSVISGTGGAQPTITAVAYSGTNGQAITYPSYVGTPNAVPTWVDDATDHAYPVNGVGAIVQDTTKTVQTQVRQISTNVSETQQYDGYFATYSGNLYQTAQKNTRRQQA